jgi:glyoxylase-like metal-dependent hydrolase (beta-lactamase superfamily II)
MDEKVFAIEELAPDLARLRVAFVNVYFVGSPYGGASTLHGRAAASWALVDAGLAIGAAPILDAAAARYGAARRPDAIILTHGHFDHVGALDALLRVWDVPVYAHSLELPYLTGQADYPPPDPTVGHGPPPRLAPRVPERGIDLGDRVRPLPPGGEVPGMRGWRWIHTPGHSPGHVSLFRARNRALIAGDAVTTTPRDSVFSMLTQAKELHGPPAYFTIDWDHARRSVAHLAALQPILLAAGHGTPLFSESVPADLEALARDFDTRARPLRGRYVHQPALTDDRGVVSLPPPLRSSGVRWGMLSGVAAAAFAGTWLYRRFGRRTGAGPQYGLGPDPATDAVTTPPEPAPEAAADPRARSIEPRT